MLQNPSETYSSNFYKSLPKVELHRHLEGSVRLRTLLEIGRAHGMDIPGTRKLRELVQIASNEEYTFTNFLSKFQTLRLFYRSPEIIERITLEAIEDAASDNIKYLELRFTPVALSRAEGFPLEDVIEWVVSSAKSAERLYGVKTRLIASVNRNEDIQQATQVVKTAVDYKDNGVIGVDLAGDEANFSGMGFIGVFKEAKQAGLKITIHAGEWAGSESVSNAILYLGADRIGHGVRVLEDPKVVELAREKEIPFEVCVTSNYQSGVIPSDNVHPITRMLDLGLNASINTDDPSISQITLSDEYQFICDDLGLSIDNLITRIESAAASSFVSNQEKVELLQMLKNELSVVKN